MISIILCVLGIHGLFFYRNLALKAGSWALFQLGLIFFLFNLASLGDPLTNVLILQTAGITLAVILLQGALCLKLWKRFKTLDGREIAGKVSK